MSAKDTSVRGAVGSRRSIARTALLLLPVQVVFRTGEAIVPLLLAAWFGRTPETDAYYFASALFVFAGSFVASAFQDSALIPVLSQLQARDRVEHVRTIRALFGYTLAFGAALGVAAGAVTLAWFAWRYEGPVFRDAAWLIPPFALYLMALAVRALFVGVMNQRGRYTVHPVASGIGIAVALALIAGVRGAWGIRILPAAWLLQELLAALIAGTIASLDLEARLRPTLERSATLDHFFRLALSEVVGGAITRLNPVVDQAIAGLTRVVGGGTLLRYAFDVASLPTSAAQATVFPPLLSHLSEDAAAKHWDAFEQTVHRALAGVCGVLLAMCALVFACRAPLLRLAFLHGAMDAAGVDGINEVLPYALAGVAPFGALLVLARAHVALQNSRIMISMGILNATLNALLDVALYRWLGLRGIALSTSLMQAAVAAVFWVRLKARLAERRRETP
ncbi:MAG TPA: lipid II flippase MurJ [Polyangiaceae bacterium]|jgi:putative peptidoglycan lipid II flippase